MKTILLVRHADIDIPQGPAPDDWPLNAAGRLRAEALAHAAGSAGVGAVYVSPAARTQETVAPLAAKLGLQPKLTPPPDQLLQHVLSEPGAVILIAGHSNTVPEMIEALGGPPPRPTVSGHDDLFVVYLSDPDGVQVVRLKYGKQPANT